MPYWLVDSLKKAFAQKDTKTIVMCNKAWRQYLALDKE